MVCSSSSSKVMASSGCIASASCAVSSGVGRSGGARCLNSWADTTCASPSGVMILTGEGRGPGGTGRGRLPLYPLPLIAPSTSWLIHEAASFLSPQACDRGARRETIGRRERRLRDDGPSAQRHGAQCPGGPTDGRPTVVHMPSEERGDERRHFTDDRAAVRA